MDNIFNVIDGLEYDFHNNMGFIFMIDILRDNFPEVFDFFKKRKITRIETDDGIVMLDTTNLPKGRVKAGKAQVFYTDRRNFYIEPDKLKKWADNPKVYR